MENKSNSLNRIKRHQREKVLRFSIRKYSFGAASVAVAALMFLGARVASADSVIENHSQPTTDVVNQKEKDKPLAEIQQPTDNKVEVAQNPSEKELVTNIESVVKVVDKAKLKKVVEELKTTLSSKSDLDKSVISPIKDRVQKGQALLDSDTATQKDVNELLSLLESDLTALSNATKESSKVQETATENKTEIKDNKTASELSEADKTISDKKESLKLSAEQLQAAVLELPEHESTKEVFENANELLGLAQGVIQNTTISLNEVEDMTKRVKRMFNSVKNATTRLNSGARDSRNGQRMAQGTGERAAAVSQTWTSERNLLSYQRFRASDFNGNLQNGNRQFTENKVDMTARFETINGSKYVVYDVFFNNDGRVMGGSTHQVIYKLILQPEILDLNPNGTYKGDTLRDMKFEIYRKNGDNGTLSQNPGNFSKTGTANFNFLSDHEKTKEGLTYYYNLDIRHNGSYGLDMKDTFKSNRNDPFLTMAVSRNGVYNNYSYGFGVMTLNDRDAVHMQVKAKLKPGVTEEKVKEAYTLAVAVTQRPTTNQSYVFVSGKNASENYTNVPDRPVVPTVTQSEEYPIKGKEVTKTVGETIENVSNPVSSGFVVRNDNTTHFPSDVRWSWPNGQPNTNTAGVFNYRVTANYYDNSSNSTTVTLKVKPKKPVIEQSSVNEKAGKTGQTVTVNVGNGVPTGSTVTLYSGTKVIGTGNTTGSTATIRVSEALPSTAITAKTTVRNNGTVESELSAPATPTEVPDRVAPTVLINGNRLTANADDNRFIIYRGANFNPTFRVQDDKNNVTLSITDFPKGVANVSTNGSKDLSYTIPGNTVAPDAPFGESTATVVASDGRNSITYRFKYRIVDIQAKNSTTENRALGSALGNPHDHFKVAESNTVENDKYYPDNMRFVWKELNTRTFQITDVPNNTKLNEIGTITKYIATAVFPNTVNSKTIDRVNYTIYTPTQKPVQMTFNVTDNVKPTVKLVQNNQDITLSESTPEARVPKVTVYRGEKAEITVKALDNTGKLSRFATSGLPSGVTETGASSSDSATDAAPLAHTLSGKVATNTALGDKVLTVVASDKTTPTNTTTVKFKLDVKAQNEKYTPTAGTTPVAVNNIGSISPSDLEKIKNSVTVPNLSPEATRDGGVTKTLKNNGAVTTNNGKKYVTVEVMYPDRSKDEVPVEVQQNTNVVKRPIINLKQGETLSAAEMKTIVELQDGSSKQPLPADAVVTATFNTNTVRDGNWTNITVRFNDRTTKTVSVNYNVKATFPVANTVYDFRGVTRTNDSESNYYINKGLPNGMNWFVKKGTETKPNAKIQTYLATDGLGKTDYTFGAYYAASRFNDNESNINLKLKHEGTVSHHVYDVMAAANKITVNNGATLTEANAKAAVTKVAGSEDLPAGTTYEWVADENGTALTNKTVTEFGEATRYVKVTLPKSQETSDNSPAATQRQSSKIIRVTVKVNETVKPTVKLVQNNQDTTLSELTPEARVPKVTVYRGEKAEITVKASDNTGKLSRFATSGLPSGVTETGASSSDSATDAAPLAHTLSGKVATNTALGDKVLTVVASDKTTPTNTTTVKFKLDVKAQNEKYTPTAGTTVKVGNIGTISQPDGDKIKNSVTVPNLSPEATRDGGVTKTLKNNGRVTAKNGKNYVTVEVIYPDRSKDEVDVAVEEVLKAGEKNPTNPAVEGQPYTSNEKVINPNKPGTTVTPTPTNGLTVGTDGKVTGKPTGIKWTGDETSKTVNIPVTVSRTGDTPVTVTIPVVVQRDLDGDGKPDVSDDDIDGDGIPNEKDTTPRQVTPLDAGKVNPTNPAVEGQPYTSNEKVINPNKPGTTVTPTPTNGLTVGTDGKVTGKPTGIKWTGDETSKTVNIPVTVTRTGDTPVTVTIPVVVQRDLDGDGKPDVSDDDIDGDGIPNDQDPAPRVKDGLTAGKVNPTNPAVDGQPYTSNEKVINPNKPGTTVTPTPTNGLTIDGTSGKVTGTPTGLTWNGDDTEQTVNIPVTVSRTGDTPVTVTIPVVVQRDLDKGEKPLDAGKVTPTNPAVDGQPYTSNEKVINPNKPGTTVTPTPTNGLTVGTDGKVTGKPTGIKWTGDETSKTVNIPVTVSRTGDTPVTVTIPVVVQRDLDGDGKPDVSDDDIDGDGIPNEKDTTPRQVTPLDAGKVNPTNPAVEGQPYTSNEKVINPNKPGTTVTPTPTNGLTVGTDGKVTGKPTGIKWTGDETSKTVNIPVTVTRTGDTPVTVTIPVVVQRDLDGDGKPDVSDDDIDGDGIPNDQDPAPRVKDGLTAGKVNPTNPAVDGQPYTSNEKVINPNKPGTTVTPTPTNGLTIDGTSGKVTGTPTGLTWNGDDTEQTVNIPVTVSRTGDTPVTVTIPVVVQRDLDKGEKPLDAGKVTPTNPAVDGQPYTSNEKVINPNKPGTTVTPTPTNGLTIDGTSGKVTGTPTGLTWNGDDTEQTVNIPVTVSRTGDTPVTVTIPVVVQRDLDGDGTPDVSDDDIDGDGIPNDQDPAPRVKDALTAGKVTPTNPAVDGQPYTSNEKVINPNKPGTTVTPTPTNGLTIDGTSGKVTGTPTGLTWNGDDTEQTVNIPVTVSRTGDTPVTVTIPVVVQRDLDGDGTPDVSDDDIDGDGIPNDQDPAPRVKDGLTAGKVNPTNPAVDGQPYTSNEKVINPNKPGTTVTPTPTNGLTIDGTSGKVTGTPTGLTWNGDDTEQTVNIPVTVSRTGDTPVTVTIPVVVQRDLDKGEKPLDAGKVTPTNPAVDGQPYTSNEKVINPNKPGTTVTPTPTNGLTIDGTSGKVTGTPTGLTWNGDDTEQTVNIPVTVSRTGDTPVTVTIPVVVQRDLDGDGTPDVSDDDIDGDGIPNDQDPAPRVKDGLTAGKVTPTNPAVDGQPYTSNEKVINPNKPGTTVTPTPTNGLTIDGTSGKVTGTPTGLTWNGDDTEQTVNIPVTVSRTGDTPVTVTIPVVVQRDLDKGEKPLDAGKVTPTNPAVDGQPYTSNEKVINPNKPGTTVTPTPTNGLTIDGTSGKVTGTPTGLTWNGDDTEQTVNIPVTVSRTGDTPVTVTIPVVVQRDLDGDGTPDVSDDDIDGDGIPNDQDPAPRVKDALTAGKVTPTNPAVDGQPYTSNEKVINPNKPGTTVTPTPTNGLTIDGTSGKVTGTPTGLTWNGDDTEQTVNIPVTVSRTGDTPVTVTIPVVVQRDLDGDGTPDVSDDDIDGDGIPNDQDPAPRVKDGLTAGKVTPTNPAVDGQPYTSNEKVINPNKPGTTVTPTPTNGLTIDGTSGKVTGTPTGLTWNGDDTEQTVNIPVTVSRTGDTPVTVTIPVVVQRDLDKGEKPLDAGKVTPTNPAVDGQPYTSNEKVINPNKPGTTVTPTPTNGLTIDGTSGKVTGTPTGLTWNGDDTEQTVNIPVTVSRTGDTPVTVTIPVVVQRDLDGDGTPDVSDDDIDGDGIPNDQDPAPRVKDALTAGKVTPTNPAVDGQPYTSNEKVINPNKPGTTVTPTPTNGLTIDGTSGKVTGTPTGLTWNGDDTEQTVNIPVTVSRTGDTPVTVTIPVVVQRDLDGDGTPDVSDDDIDGDGIPNDQDPAPRVKDGLTAGKVTPTNPAVDGQPYTSNEKVINPNKPGTTVTPTPTNGLTIDGTSGKVTGTPTGLTWNGDDTEQTVNIPVTVSRTGDTPVTVTIPVVVQRDLDGDGTPDVSDDDIDGDGIPNDQDPAPRVKDGLTAGKVTPTNPAVDGQPYTSNEKVINPNKPGTTVTPTPTNGLTIDGTSGKVTGTPTGLTWNGDDTEQTVNIPVTVSRTGDTPVTVTIPVVVQRDLDGDGTPDVSDDDIDGDGIPNDQDPAPRVKDGLTAGKVTPTNPAVDGQPYTSNEKVINPNKPGTTVTPTPTNGLTIDGTSGKVTGTPTGLTWNGDDTEQTVNIPVTVSRTGDTPVTVTIPVVVQRDVTKTPTFTVGNQDPTDGHVDVTVSGVPDGTKVTLPGVNGEKVVTGGKVTLTNDELPETPQTGKGRAQEDGKLPKEGTSDITIPGKISSSKGEPEVQTETPDYTNTIPVTPVKPDTNGGSGQDTPAPATPTPNAVTPNADQIDTKTTVDNGAKSNDSQNVLPNTGTESNATLASLGLLGLLSGFGLVARKKKED